MDKGKDVIPESGDVFGWSQWYLSKNRGDDTNMIPSLLRIFESDLWCQKSKILGLRFKVKHDPKEYAMNLEDSTDYNKELKEALKRLKYTLEFLTLKTRFHNDEFYEYRKELYRLRCRYNIHQGIYNNPYESIEIELLKG